MVFHHFASYILVKYHAIDVKDENNSIAVLTKVPIAVDSSGHEGYKTVSTIRLISPSTNHTSLRLIKTELIIDLIDRHRTLRQQPPIDMIQF